MTEQLALEVAAPRAYVCCGLPCGDLGEARTVPRPHADDCPNPSVGTWIDRATGWPIRRLHCIAADGTCPHGGRFPGRPGLADPHDGACCLELRARP